MTKKLSSIGHIILFLSLSSCAHIPTDQVKTSQEDINQAQLAQDIRMDKDAWPDITWWTNYQDEQLNHLISIALENGPTLKVAASRIDSAGAKLKRYAAEEGVDVSLEAQTNRQRYSANGLLPAPIGGSFYNESSAQVQAHYDFDWWGKHHASIAAAVGEMNAQKAEFEQTKQTLAATIAQSYFKIQGTWARIDNLKKLIEIQEKIIEDQAKREHYGLVNADERHLAEIHLVNMNKELAKFETESRNEREALRALLGINSEGLKNLKPQLIKNLSEALPSNLGIELLARRPDLQASQWRIQASISQVESNEAAFYPDINMKGFFGVDSLSLSHLLSAPSRTLFIGPELKLPLFDCERLQAQLGQARAKRNEMLADYNQTVFAAVREVAQQGITLQGIQAQEKEQTHALETAQLIFKQTQARFKQGLVDQHALLAANLNILEQTDSQLLLENQHVLADVALVKALGGGYQNQTTSIKASAK